MLNGAGELESQHHSEKLGGPVEGHRPSSKLKACSANKIGNSINAGNSDYGSEDCSISICDRTNTGKIQGTATIPQRSSADSVENPAAAEAAAACNAGQSLWQKAHCGSRRFARRWLTRSSRKVSPEAPEPSSMEYKESSEEQPQANVRTKGPLKGFYYWDRRWKSVV